jgi:hypothetical protein
MQGFFLCNLTTGLNWFKRIFLKVKNETMKKWFKMAANSVVIGLQRLVYLV